MAWVDDLVWCKPSFLAVPTPAFRVWVHGLAYSNGLTTRGTLTAAHQRLLGSSPKIRAALIEHGLWEERTGGDVYIHGWQERNGRTDERRVKDRDRKRLSRSVSAGQSSGQSTVVSAPVSAVAARVDVKTLRRTSRSKTLAFTTTDRGAPDRVAEGQDRASAEVQHQIGESLGEAAA